MKLRRHKHLLPRPRRYRASTQVYSLENGAGWIEVFRSASRMTQPNRLEIVGRPGMFKLVGSTGVGKRHPGIPVTLVIHDEVQMQIPKLEEL